jgi:hypothetical protein
MSEQNVMVEAARRAKSALRKAFPGTKFSVQTSGSICVEWADDGPAVEQVKDVVLTIGGVEVKHGWNNERWLNVSNGRGGFYFDRYSVPERTAWAEKLERQHLEHQQARKAIEAVLVQSGSRNGRSGGRWSRRSSRCGRRRSRPYSRRSKHCGSMPKPTSPSTPNDRAGPAGARRWSSRASCSRSARRGATSHRTPNRSRALVGGLHHQYARL